MMLLLIAPIMPRRAIFSVMRRMRQASRLSLAGRCAWKDRSRSFRAASKAILAARVIDAYFRPCPMQNRHRAVPKRAFLGLLPDWLGHCRRLKPSRLFLASHAP